MMFSIAWAHSMFSHVVKVRRSIYHDRIIFLIGLIMIQSMTAFARAQSQGDWGSAVCELRSINHRYVEISVRLPETLHELEALMRERIRHHIKRGKIECHLRFQPGDISGTELTINTHMAKQLCLAND